MPHKLQAEYYTQPLLSHGQTDRYIHINLGKHLVLFVAFYCIFFFSGFSLSLCHFIGNYFRRANFELLDPIIAVQFCSQIWFEVPSFFLLRTILIKGMRFMIRNEIRMACIIYLFPAELNVFKLLVILRIIFL